METFTFIYKTKVEQFKEQFPELYQEIYDLGYADGQAYGHYSEDPYEESPWEDSYYAVPTDDSERFCHFGSWNTIRDKAAALENSGYKAGNRDWREFLNAYRNWDNHQMYIAWNPTHKVFAVESDPGVIDELYPDLVNAKEQI
jgi:hypothetical protein